MAKPLQTELSKRALAFLGLCGLCLSPAFATAQDVTEHGGYPERFIGGGDKTPPICQLDLPNASTEAFFVKWSCSDDNAATEEIRTELYIQRKDSAAFELLTKFLGFPAAALIYEETLRVATFADGLPVRFKLVGTDRAGISVVTPARTVFANAAEVETCSLRISTRGSDSTGGTTGEPVLSVTATNASVSSQQTSETGLSVTTPEKVTADPCEISDLCEDENQITFEVTLTLESSSDESDDAVTGAIVVTPGDLASTLSGTATFSGSDLGTVDVTGTTSIDGVTADLSLTCSS